MAFFGIVRNMLLAGLGIQEKVKEFIDELVKRGELSESEGAKLVKEWTKKAEKGIERINESFCEAVSKIIEKTNLPTKYDIEKLSKQIESLSDRIKKIEEKG